MCAVMQPTWLALWSRPCCTSFNTTRFGLLLYAPHPFLLCVVAEEDIKAVMTHTCLATLILRGAPGVHCCQYILSHNANTECNILLKLFMD